jgi:FlaG/FlaF family flagellin (archaellin)
LHANLREPGWYMKSARFGSDDVLEKGLQLEKGSNGGTLEIVFSSASAQVEGAVTEHDKPVVGAQVRLRPEPETPYNHRRGQTTSTDQNGHFTVSNLTPGKYQVTAKLASEAGTPAAASDPQTVTLIERDRQSLQLKLEEPKGR